MAGGIDLREQLLARRSASNIGNDLKRYAATLPAFQGLEGDPSESVQVEGYNPLTRTPRNIVPPPGFAGFGAVAAGDRISQALDLASGLLATSGFAAGEAPSFTPDPAVQKTSGGASAVHLHQSYRGIPIYEMSRTVRFDADGNAIDLVGDHIPAIDPSFEIQPVVGVKEALTRALEVIESGQADSLDHDPYDFSPEKKAPEPPDLGGYRPTIAASFDDQSSRPVVFERGNLGATIPGHLTIFLLDKPRLAWYFKVTAPGALRQYEAVVSADGPEPEILLAQETTVRAATRAGSNATTNRPRPSATSVPRQSATSATVAGSATTGTRGAVFQTNPGNPLSAPTEVDFPLPVAQYPFENPVVPSGFPAPWVGQNQTVGPNVVALLGEKELSEPNSTLTGTSDGGRLVFRPQGTPQQLLNSNDQKLLNIFYFCNYMHDFFYILGFDEAAGNFQGDDPVTARAHPQAVFGTANMLTLPEHQSPLMNMGMVTSTGRHTAMDADVVFHEYVHGVSNRLVGGPMNVQALRAQQSGAMGEAWGDYFALTIQTYHLPPSGEERFTTGDWVTNRPGVGIRLEPYTPGYPANYDHMRTSTRYQEVHSAGEIWCATLMQINRAMGDALGDRQRGIRESWQVVVDSFKLCPNNPSFLDARDAMFKALDARKASAALTPVEFDACREAMWQTFAGFGMGDKAPRSGGRFVDAKNDFHLPDDLGGEEVPPRQVDSNLAADSSATLTRFLNANVPVPLPTGEVDDPDLQWIIEHWHDLTDRDQGYLLARAEHMLGADVSSAVAANAPLPPRIPVGADLAT